MGVQVDVAEDGLAGLARLRQGPVPGAVLLDIRMPRLDGEGFLKQLRADPALCELPVITMSGLDEPTTLPVEARLCKPFDFDELAHILASLCDG
jgi:CheY-like chemotaxis protein